MKKTLLVVFLFIATVSYAQTNLSERMAATVMNIWKDSFAVNGNTVIISRR
jgi:hypothetical protein